MAPAHLGPLIGPYRSCGRYLQEREDLKQYEKGGLLHTGLGTKTRAAI